jgi:DNA-directed RNA polymerase specialized sigma24 family protein
VDAIPSTERSTLRAGSGFDLRAFLGRTESQKHLRAVVGRRMRGAPPELVDEIVQEANLAALEAKSPPRAAETAPGWLATVATRAVIARIRKNASEARWLDRETDAWDLEEMIAAATEEPASDPWLLSAWLARAVAGSERDQETLELLSYKARSKKTYDEVAEEHGTTVPALKSRIHEFKNRYSRRRKQRQMMLVFLFGGGVAVVAIVAYVIARLLLPAPAPPPPAVPALVPVPSAVPTVTFEPAAPHREPPSDDRKPRRP